MDDQELDARCQDWAHWARTRKYFAPPELPPNILARMQPQRVAPREPDGPMDAELSFFNMAIQRLQEDNPNGAMCFWLYYYHKASDIKVIAAEMGISRKTFYNRVHAFGRLALKWASTIKRAHLELSSQKAECVDD